MKDDARGTGGARPTLVLAASTMLGALALAIDYGMKFSGAKEFISAPWRLAFPHLAFLKFDLDGIPIFCAMALFGLTASAIASAILGLGILARAPHLFGLVGGSMKALAEFSTSAGAYLGMRVGRGRVRTALCVLLALIMRIIAMSLANLAILPPAYGIPVPVLLGLLPLIALFNILQGLITALLGLSVALAVARRAPHILPGGAPLRATS